MWLHVPAQQGDTSQRPSHAPYRVRDVATMTSYGVTRRGSCVEQVHRGSDGRGSKKKWVNDTSKSDVMAVQHAETSGSLSRKMVWLT